MAEIFHKCLTRARSEKGFTLIELLVVLVILGILLAIAVPSYLGFRDRAQAKAAGSNVRAAIPTAEAYYADHNNYAFNLLSTGGAAATPWDALHSIDQGIAKAQVGGAGDGMVVTVLGGGTGYCLADFRGTHEGHVTGPGGTVTTTGAC